MSRTGSPAPQPALDFMALADDDLNGDCYITGAEGEAELLVAQNVVYFPHGCPAATEQQVGQRVAINTRMANLFVYCNAKRSIAAGRSALIAGRVAYLRFLAVRNGLVSPLFDADVHHVRYNHAEQLTEAETNADNAELTVNNQVLRELATNVPTDVRAIMRRYFSDMACCVAYVFRVRGHHYMAPFQERYTTLWIRCLHGDPERMLDWQYIATDALHAIMPDVLDNYWADCVSNARCAGALIKRFDSAPAGAAGIMALKRGLDDVMMLFPGVVANVPQAYQAFQEMVNRIQGGRWVGSVNARFYGATRVRIRESDVGALASVVLGVYTQLANDSKLTESPSLKRLAEIAPATGGAIGLAARRATQSDEFSLLASAGQGQIMAP